MMRAVRVHADVPNVLASSTFVPFGKSEKYQLNNPGLWVGDPDR